MLWEYWSVSVRNMENKDIYYSIVVFWTITIECILLYIEKFFCIWIVFWWVIIKSHILLGEVDLISPSSLIPFHMVRPSHETSLNWSFMRAGKKQTVCFCKTGKCSEKKSVRHFVSAQNRAPDSVLYRNTQGANYPCTLSPPDLKLLQILSEILGKALGWKCICLG